MDNHTLTVIPGTWTVDEFDKRVRGFRAALIAYGDVFKGEAAPAPAAAKKPKKERARPFGVSIRQSFRGQVLGVITKLKVGQMTFFPHVETDHTQRRICNAVYDHRRLTGENLHIRTSRVTVGNTPGVRVMRVA
jgi:hypothetical protein